MPVDQDDPLHAIAPDAAPIFARAARADARAERRLNAAIDDFFLAAHERLDDRTRAALHAAIGALLERMERELAAHATRLLSRGAGGIVTADPAETLRRLVDAGLLRDSDLMAELIGQIRLALLGRSLVANREPGTPAMLLPRLAQGDDAVTATAARDYILADGRRDATIGLPPDLHRRVVWWIAAALREGRRGMADQALVDAAVRSIDAHDEGARLDPIALRLAAAIDARADELPELLIEALGDGRAELAAALIAYIQRIDLREARALLLDPDGDRLWLVLRAHGFARDALARVALLLADADPRRDIEAFADLLDTIAAIPVSAAREALAPLSLHADFRRAIRALERSRRA